MQKSNPSFTPNIPSGPFQASNFDPARTNVSSPTLKTVYIVFEKPKAPAAVIQELSSCNFFVAMPPGSITSGHEKVVEVMVPVQTSAASICDKIGQAFSDVIDVTAEFRTYRIGVAATDCKQAAEALQECAIKVNPLDYISNGTAFCTIITGTAVSAGKIAECLNEAKIEPSCIEAIVSGGPLPGSNWNAISAGGSTPYNIPFIVRNVFPILGSDLFNGGPVAHTLSNAGVTPQQFWATLNAAAQYWTGRAPWTTPTAFQTNPWTTSPWSFNPPAWNTPYGVQATGVPVNVPFAVNPANYATVPQTYGTASSPFNPSFQPVSPLGFHPSAMGTAVDANVASRLFGELRNPMSTMCQSLQNLGIEPLALSTLLAPLCTDPRALATTSTVSAPPMYDAVGAAAH